MDALYQAARLHPPADRAAFLADACGDDSDLRWDVESRLSEVPEDETRSRGPSAAPAPAPPPTDWNGLHLLAELGAGGFGRVYRARDPVLQRDVALKIIALRSPEDAAEVLREGQMLARVRHRGVVTVYAAQRVGDEVGLTMELVDGQTLSDVVRQQGPLGPEEAAVIGVSLCQALAAVHAAGLVHRDVKTRNVMRETGGRIVLMDFGLGRDLEVRRGQTTSDLSGTPPYIAPELFSGQPASAASDLYSLGVLLFYLVTREYPVPARTIAELADAYAAGSRRLLTDVRPDLPGRFVQAVEGALAPRPSDRYATAAAMLRVLIDVAPGAPAGMEHGTSRAREASGTTAGNVPAVGRQSPVARWATGLAAGVIGVTALGMITSAAYNLALGRRGAFADDTVSTWFTYGARSLVTPSIYAVLILVAILAVRAVLRIIRPAARPLSERSATLARHLSSRLGITDAAAGGQWLLLGQGLSLAASLWLFRDVLGAMVRFPDSADADTVAILSATSAAPILYRQTLSLVLVATLLGWRALLTHPTAGRAIDTGTKVGGAVLLAATLLLLELPYRLMFQNERPIVEHAGLWCYEVGRTPDRALVYCPEWSRPRIRSVEATTDLVRTGRYGDVFSRPGGGGP